MSYHVMSAAHPLTHSLAQSLTAAHLGGYDISAPPSPSPRPRTNSSHLTLRPSYPVVPSPSPAAPQASATLHSSDPPPPTLGNGKRHRRRFRVGLLLRDAGKAGWFLAREEECSWGIMGLRWSVALTAVDGICCASWEPKGCCC